METQKVDFNDHEQRKKYYRDYASKNKQILKEKQSDTWNVQHVKAKYNIATYRNT